MDAGNVYRHNYDNVAEAFVWQTVKHGLEPLLAAIVAEIDDPAGQASVDFD